MKLLPFCFDSKRLVFDDLFSTKEHTLLGEFIMAVNLNVPYFNQYDNEIEPDRTCGATSAAMCLAYFKVPDFGSMKQFEDDVKNRFDSLGLNHGAPSDIRILIERLGLRDNLTMTGRVSDITRALDGGEVCILHGYWTNSGHILVIRGYTDNGDFYVNDPAGEWFYGGYSRNSRNGNDTKGENKVYSRKLISSAANSDSLRGALRYYDTWNSNEIESTATMWLHRVSGSLV